MQWKQNKKGNKIKKFFYSHEPTYLSGQEDREDETEGRDRTGLRFFVLFFLKCGSILFNLFFVGILFSIEV